MLTQTIEIVWCEQHCKIDCKVIVLYSALIETSQRRSIEYGTEKNIKCLKSHQKNKRIKTKTKQNLLKDYSTHSRLFSSPSTTSLISLARYLSFCSRTIESSCGSNFAIRPQNEWNGLPILQFQSLYTRTHVRLTFLNYPGYRQISVVITMVIAS